MPEMTSATGPAVALADGHVTADMTPARRRWTLALAGLGAFMSALDVVVVVATALPTMRMQLGASLADLEWTINANAVTASVPPGDVGVAAGTNNALNALGGVFGIAILAAVFAARGSYASPAAFIDGFRPTEWVAAAVAAVGLPIAALSPSKSTQEEIR